MEEICNGLEWLFYGTWSDKSFMVRVWKWHWDQEAWLCMTDGESSSKKWLKWLKKTFSEYSFRKMSSYIGSDEWSPVNQFIVLLADKSHINDQGQDADF